MAKKKVKSTISAVREVMEGMAYSQEPNPENFLTRWVMVSEWLAPDGSRFLRCTAPESMTPWDANALLSAGIEMELDVK